MKNPIRDLRICTGQSTFPPTPTGTSFNRTPPLDPILAMDSPSSSKGPSRSVSPYPNPGSSSQQSNPFSNSFDSPKSSRFSRIKQSLKDNWSAGTDPKHFHEKRRRGTPEYSDISSSNSRSTSRGPSQRPRTEAPTPERSIRPGPSRAATDRLAPRSHFSGSSRNASKRAKDEKAIRKMKREAAQRLEIKHHREFERGEFSSLDGNGSPFHAPLHMLAEANDARYRADEKRKMHYEWERRRSEIERRRAHAPAELHDKVETYGRNPFERAEPSWREPEYDKDPYERASPSPALSPRSTEHKETYKAENPDQAPAFDSEDPFEESSSDEQILEIIDAYTYRWSGLQPLTPPPAHSPHVDPEPETEDWEEEDEILDTYFQSARHGWSAQDQPLSPLVTPHPEPEQQSQLLEPDVDQQSRGEFEGIINRLTMPDQEHSREERDIYHAHVTRRRREPSGREFF